jgi:hypothetical protein
MIMNTASAQLYIWLHAAVLLLLLFITIQKKYSL